MRTHIKGLALLVLPAVVWLFINATVNRHPHMLADGHYYYHAHPYDKTSHGPFHPDSHRHSEKEFILLSFLSNPAVLLILFLCLISILQAGPFLFRSPLNHTEPARKYYQLYHYHAPPVY